MVEKFADEHRWNALVGTVDIDAQKTIAAKYNVHGIPSLFLFRDGKIVKEEGGGLVSADELEEFLND